MTGTPTVRGSARSSRSSPKPSSRGIITSDRIRSGACRRTAASAASPSGTASTVYDRPAAARRTAACRRCRPPPAHGAGRRLAARRGGRDGQVVRLRRHIGARSVLAGVGQPPQRLLHERARPGRRGAVVRPRADLLTGKVGRPQRDRDGERRPPADLALGGDRPAVQPDQLLHQGQPDAAALVGAAPGVLDPVEPLEQPRHLLGGDARAGVPHPQLGGLARPAAGRRRSRPRR